ncbi:MAG: hypothetical protein AAF310_03780 [Myxococcota bacterium]
MSHYVMPLSPIEREIVAVLEPVLAAQQCELVRICVSVSSNKQVDIFVDNIDTDHHGNRSSIRVDKLQTLHLLVQDVLSAALQHTLLPGSYALQLSSPGLDRPLTRLRHFHKAVGKRICVRLAHSMQSKLQTGVLLNVQQSGIVLKDLDDSAARSLLLQWHEMQEVICLYDFAYRRDQKSLATKLSTAGRGK